MLKKLWNDDAGVVTIEYLVLGTFLGIALIVGVHSLASSINAELVELGNSVMSFSQEYTASGFTTCSSSTEGSAATDVNGSNELNITAGTPSVIDVSQCQ